AMTYIPNILINLNEVHTSAVLSALAIPLAVGIYLGLIYYYGGNLWLCMIIHGVYLSITTLEADIFINLLSGVYSLGLLIYLIYKILGYYKHVDKEDENMEFEEEEVAIESKCTEEVEHQANVDYTHEIERQPQVEALKETENTDTSQVEKLEEVIVTSKEVEDKAIHESKVVEVPKFKNIEPVPTEKLEQTTILPNLENEEEEDLGKIAAIPNTQEELGKVVNLQDRKQKMERSAKKIEDLDITVVMPCITEADMKENQTRFEPKDVELKIQAEPNFIAHLEKYLGDFEGIYKQIVPTEIPIDILYFSGEKHNAIVTNGMRAVTMSVPPELKGYEQVELMMFIDKSFDLSCEGMHTEENAWLIRLLTDLALYPSQINSYLGWGHIVGNGEELEAYNASAAYCGALIYPPMVQEDMTFYRYIEKDKNIFIYNVMPLFKDELRFIQEHSSDQFVNLMSEMGVSQVVKPKRLNVIKNMNR
ncbi:MAG: suppressor of fused domain protein, partial [Candidatus Cellulosilyticum pullistercoris]|nr:suppressor of fused domain protein [Candidatus Cellulosilyticum pullistercoris]